MQSARNSSRMLEEASATGAAILAKYSEQRERLKVSLFSKFLVFTVICRQIQWHWIFVQGAQRKALDVLNTLGLSNSVLRIIERRNRVDQWIKYAGMILTFVIVIAFLRWVRWPISYFSLTWNRVCCIFYLSCFYTEKVFLVTKCILCLIITTHYTIHNITLNWHSKPHAYRIQMPCIHLSFLQQ